MFNIFNGTIQKVRKITAKKLIMVILAQNTIRIVISNESTRCNMAIDEKGIAQTVTSNYSCIIPFIYRSIEIGGNIQITEANWVGECQKNTIWKNKYFGMQTKKKIYKAAINKINNRSIYPQKHK